jgi:hypothetical protein
MSALTPHIRVLRAVASALRDKRPTIVDDPSHIVALGMLGTADALAAAAKALEAEEAALQPPREGKDRPITYHPKGKSTE